MKKLLVPVYAPHNGEHGIKLAAEIASRSLFTVRLVAFKYPFLDQADFSESNIEIDLEALAKPFFSSSLLIEYDYVYERVDINSYVKNQMISLIVAEVNEREAEKLFTISHYPIILASKDFDTNNLHDIFLPLSVIRSERLIDGLTVLRDFANSLDAKINLMHFIDPTTNDIELYDFFTLLAEAVGFSNFSINIIKVSDTMNSYSEYFHKSKADFFAFVNEGNRGDHLKQSLHNLISSVRKPIFFFNLNPSINEVAINEPEYSQS